ncbi:unnamed protein product [Prunus armeniaca]
MATDIQKLIGTSEEDEDEEMEMDVKEEGDDDDEEDAEKLVVCWDFISLVQFLLSNMYFNIIFFKKGLKL